MSEPPAPDIDPNDATPDEARVAWSQHARELDAIHRAPVRPREETAPDLWDLLEDKSGDEWDPHFRPPLNAFGTRTRVIIDLIAVVMLLFVGVGLVAILPRYTSAAAIVISPVLFVAIVAFIASHKKRWARFRPVDISELRRLRDQYPVEAPAPLTGGVGATSTHRNAGGDAWSDPKRAESGGSVLGLMGGQSLCITLGAFLTVITSAGPAAILSPVVPILALGCLLVVAARIGERAGVLMAVLSIPIALMLSFFTCCGIGMVLS